jgi:uncharacterized DUF497 family protein
LRWCLSVATRQLRTAASTVGRVAREWYSFYTALEFESDDAKSATNLKKHGIDFVQAQAIWADANRWEGPVPFDAEPRFQVLGAIRGVVWSAFITYRNGRIRIISVRRARHEEVAAYRSL